MRKDLLCALLALALLPSCAAPASDNPAPEPAVPAAQTFASAETETPQAATVMTGEESVESCAQVLLDSQPDGEDYRLLSQADTEFYLSEVYGIPEDCRGIATLVYTAGGLDARELAVVYGTDGLASNTAAGAFETYCQSRLGDFTGYAPDQEELVKKALVMEGNMALLMICSDPDAAQKAMEEDLSHLVITPYDPNAAPPEPYDWTKEVNGKGWRIFDPPGEFDMTPYDTDPILAAYVTGDESGLSGKDAAILSRCWEALELCVTEDMTDFRKELNLHDWLVENCAYDQTVLDPATPMGREGNLDPWGPLTKGYGICLGYATTFQLLMDMAGVECITVVGASSNSSQDHAWNMVRLEGGWYCVDVTWDDTTILHPEAYSPEELSRKRHRYFNVTSDRLRQSDHQWDYENVPEATADRFRWDGTGALPG